MKPFTLKIGSALLAMGMLSSCAPKLPTSTRNAMTSVAIAPTSVEATAGEEPDATTPRTDYTMMAGGGALGALISMGINEGVAASQKRKFRGSNEEAMAVVMANTPRDLQKAANAEVEKVLKREPFFGPRLRSQAPYVWESKLVSYKLKRVGEKDEDILLAPQVTVVTTLKDPRGKVLISRSNTGISAVQHTCKTFAANPKLIEQGYADAMKNMATTFGTNLAEFMRP